MVMILKCRLFVFKSILFSVVWTKINNPLFSCSVCLMRQMQSKYQPTQTLKQSHKHSDTCSTKLCRFQQHVSLCHRFRKSIFTWKGKGTALDHATIQLSIEMTRTIAQIPWNAYDKSKKKKKFQMIHGMTVMKLEFCIESVIVKPLMGPQCGIQSNQTVKKNHVKRSTKFVWLFT